LVLGTAQIGMDYGVGNVTGRPSPGAAIALLHSAAELGVAALDTAPGYGDAEDLIGRSAVRLDVFTKLDPAVEPAASLQTSLRRLARDSVAVVSLHQPDLVEADPTDVIGRALRHQGELFESLGASTYTRAQFLAAVGDPRITTIQAPVNVADQRLVRSGLLEKASAAGKRVVARSVYLQGALALPPTSLPEHLTALVKTNEALAHLAGDAGLRVADLLLRFVRDLPGVTDILLGCETDAQLTESVRAFNAPRLDPHVRSALEGLAMDDEAVVDPRRWTAK
jgi:aryl-alcohol dehydrogenase-like predicted oxidoreductase